MSVLQIIMKYIKAAQMKPYDIELSSDFAVTNYRYFNCTYGMNFIFVNAGLKYAIQCFILLRGLGF